MTAVIVLLSLFGAPSGARAAAPAGYTCDVSGSISGKLPGVRIAAMVLTGEGTLHCVSGEGAERKELSVPVTLNVIGAQPANGIDFSSVPPEPISAASIGPVTMPEELYYQFFLTKSASGLLATRRAPGLSFELSLNGSLAPRLVGAYLHILPH